MENRGVLRICLPYIGWASYKLYLTGLGFKTFICLSWNHSTAFHVYCVSAAPDQRQIPTRLPLFLLRVPSRDHAQSAHTASTKQWESLVKEKQVSCLYFKLVFHVSCDVTKSGTSSIIKTFLLAPLYAAWQKQDRVSDGCWWDELSGYIAGIFGKDTRCSRIYCHCGKGI